MEDVNKKQKRTIPLKIYLILQYLSNFLQISTVYSELILKSFECRFYFKRDILSENVYIFYLIKIFNT